mmetsp:Transcript_69028/g.162406  ORF Transcript_69028/g.162406 Transcript_69028/m.162406 type:complete len:217 (-) Transcript_69028:159-809(-)
MLRTDGILTGGAVLVRRMRVGLVFGAARAETMAAALRLALSGIDAAMSDVGEPSGGVGSLASSSPRRREDGPRDRSPRSIDALRADGSTVATSSSSSLSESVSSLTGHALGSLESTVAGVVSFFPFPTLFFLRRLGDILPESVLPESVLPESVLSESVLSESVLLDLLLCSAFTSSANTLDAATSPADRTVSNRGLGVALSVASAVVLGSGCCGGC